MPNMEERDSNSGMQKSKYLNFLMKCTKYLLVFYTSITNNYLYN